MQAQIYEEAEFRLLTDHDHRALILGGTSLTQAVANELASRGIPVAVVDDEGLNRTDIQHTVDQAGGQLHWLSGRLGPQDLIEQASQTLDGLTTLINLCMPDPSQTHQTALNHCDAILARSLAAAQYMSQHSGGAIVNHCALPVMYAGGELEDYMSSVRGAITGVIRTIARKYGRQNVRSVGVQTGLLDVPEVHAWASPAVKAVEVPAKRWGSARECAKLITFCGIDASYITGQVLILDGGLTAGLSGT